MDKTLNELVANVSKSKKLAKDVYFRTMSRQTINRVYDAVGATMKLQKTADSKSINPACDKATEACECAAIPDKLKFKLPSASKGDDVMKGRLDTTIKNVTEHMNNISKECMCFYKSCPKKSLSRSERLHFTAYHCKTCQKSPVRKTKKDGSKSSSSGNKSDSSSANSSPTQIDSQKTSRKMAKTKSGMPKIRSKESVYVYDKNSSHLTEETKQVSELDSSPPYWDTVSGDCGNRVTFSRQPFAPYAHPSKHPTFFTIGSSSDESISTEASGDGKKDLWLNKKLIKKKAKKIADASHVAKQRNHGSPPKFAWEKSSPTKEASGASISTGSTHLAGHGLHTRDVKQWGGRVMDTSATEQGICILTQPGQYVVRKPVVGSGEKLFDVRPGQFISLNLSDLDSR